MRDLHQLTDEQKRQHREKFGGYNDFPPNWRPCDPDKFWGRFLVYSCDLQEFRQMMNPASEIENYPPDHYGHRTVRNAHLYFYSDDTGLAMVDNYDHGASKHRAPLLYEFAPCHHENRVGVPEKSRMCYHVTRCTDCGREFAVDSSD